MHGRIESTLHAAANDLEYVLGKLRAVLDLVEALEQDESLTNAQRDVLLDASNQITNCILTLR